MPPTRIDWTDATAWSTGGLYRVRPGGGPGLLPPPVRYRLYAVSPSGGRLYVGLKRRGDQPFAEGAYLMAKADWRDLHRDYAALRPRLRSFVAGRRWATDQVYFHDEVHPLGPGEAGLRPFGNLGVIMGLGHIRARPDWFDDVAALAAFYERLHAETGRGFELWANFYPLFTIEAALPAIAGGPTDLAGLRAALESAAADLPRVAAETGYRGMGPPLGERGLLKAIEAAMWGGEAGDGADAEPPNSVNPEV